MTPRMVYALQCRRFEKLQREEWLFGNLASEVANGSFNRRKKNVAPEDFMLHPPERKVLDPSMANDALLAQMSKLLPAGAIQRVDKL